MTARRFFVEALELETSWMADATCARVPMLPWIEDRRRVPKVVLEVMAGVCLRCPVWERCNGFVDEAEITAGFWAGVSRNGLSADDYRRTSELGGKAA